LNDQREEQNELLFQSPDNDVEGMPPWAGDCVPGRPSPGETSFGESLILRRIERFPLIADGEEGALVTHNVEMQGTAFIRT
jgi:hypothetical protein